MVWFLGAIVIVVLLGVAVFFLREGNGPEAEVDGAAEVAEVVSVDLADGAVTVIDAAEVMTSDGVADVAVAVSVDDAGVVDEAVLEAAPAVVDEDDVRPA